MRFRVCRFWSYPKALPSVQNIPMTPREAGVLPMSTATHQEYDAGRDRLNDEEFGSCKMKDMVGTKTRKRLEREEERKRIESNKVARIERREKEDREAAERRAAFEKCHPECTCGESPCPMAKLKLCPTCNEIKSGLCRKRECKAVRDGVQLTIDAPSMPVVVAEVSE